MYSLLLGGRLEESLGYQFCLAIALDSQDIILSIARPPSQYVFVLRNVACLLSNSSRERQSYLHQVRGCTGKPTDVRKGMQHPACVALFVLHADCSSHGSPGVPTDEGVVDGPDLQIEW